MFEKIATIVRSFSTWSIPLRVFLWGLFVIVSSGFLGVISEFATYLYALKLGFRVPVEGIPYLRPAVSFITLIIWVGFILGFVVVYSLAKLMVLPFVVPRYVFPFMGRNKEEISKLDDALRSMRETPTMHAVSISAAAAGLVSIVLSAIFYLNSEFDNLSRYITLFFSLLIGSFFLYLTVFRPSAIKYVAFLGALFVVLVIPLMMFQPMPIRMLHTEQLPGSISEKSVQNALQGGV